SPESPGFEESARKLIDTVKAMAQVKVVRHWRTPERPGPAARPAARAGPRHAVVALATSTGGPAALQQVLSGLPSDFPAPLLVVQHIAPGFTPGLAAWLNTVCTLQVKVARHGEALAPHAVYLAPDDRHLGVSDRATVLVSNAPPVGGFRPSGT